MYIEIKGAFFVLEYLQFDNTLTRVNYSSAYTYIEYKFTTIHRVCMKRMQSLLLLTQIFWLLF